MADDNNKNPKPATHTAFALKREGRRQQFRRWLEIGSGRMGEDGSFTGYLDRTPLGGWTGYVFFAPIGAEPPPLPETKPQRPGQTDDEGDDEPDR